jgi:hypothetical protein
MEKMRKENYKRYLYYSTKFLWKNGTYYINLSLRDDLLNVAEKYGYSVVFRNTKDVKIVVTKQNYSTIY